MITQFSYTQLSDVNGWIKRIRDIGLKIFMKKRYDEVMDEVAKDVGLQQRTQRVFGIGYLPTATVQQLGISGLCQYSVQRRRRWARDL